MLHVLGMLSLSLVVVLGLMIILWIIYLFQRNIGIADVGWALGFILTSVVYLVLGEGYFWRKLLVLLIVSIWSLRLLFYLIARFQLYQERSRYELLWQSWTNHRHLKALALFISQGAVIVILSLPFALMTQNILPFFSSYEVFGLLIWMGGVIGETVADNQMSQFKQNPVNQNHVYEGGLWHYSRHPNYFFEWIIWIAYFIMALSSPWGWLSFISPVLMLYFLLQIFGIPPAEARALRIQGDAYRDYQQRTSAFFPWFYKIF